MAWKEEEHPRDDDGKFTDGNGSKSGTILPGKGKPVAKAPKTVQRLTKEEYGIWRECCDKIARGYKGVSTLVGDEHYVPVNKKIVITTGSYPFGIRMILSFRTHDSQIAFLKRINK